MNEEKKTGFQFTYSVPTERERKEIESIRRDYEEKTHELSKFEKLRALDSKAKMLPKTIAILIGIVSTLIFGLGMSIFMVWEIIILGIIICAVGVIGIIVNYPIFKKLTKFAKSKYGLEIIKLSDELLKEDNK